jgi:hypothetical protein
MKALLAISLLSFGCTTISLARLDHCTVRKTTTFTGSREDVLFCDEETPAWSNDRAVRLTQECLYQQRQMHRQDVLAAERSGESAPEADDGEAVKQCLPAAVRTMQAENEALKERVSRDEAAQARMEGGHAVLENGLTKALDRPINAVADARANSDSGANSNHPAELTHSNSDYTVPAQPVRQVVITPTQPVAVAPRAPKKPAAIAEAKRPACGTCNATLPTQTK